MATWILIVPLLALFSFSVVAGATTFGKPDLAKAVKELPDKTHVVEVEVSGGTKKTESNPGLVERFSHAAHLVCSVTSSQLARIQQHYATGRLALTVGGRQLDIVTVYGSSEQDMRGYLGGNGVKCVLVQASHVFFLPFDPHGS